MLKMDVITRNKQCLVKCVQMPTIGIDVQAAQAQDKRQTRRHDFSISAKKVVLCYNGLNYLPSSTSTSLTFFWIDL